jgi:hypothetical protein
VIVERGAERIFDETLSPKRDPAASRAGVVIVSDWRNCRNYCKAQKLVGVRGDKYRWQIVAMKPISRL